MKYNIDKFATSIKRPIHSDRLVIRPSSFEDADELFKAMQQSRCHLQKWMDWANPWPTWQQTYLFHNQAVIAFKQPKLYKHFRLVGVKSHNGAFVCTIGLTIKDIRIPSIHVSYWVRTACENQGYMTEALVATVRRLRELNFRRIETGCAVSNLKSRRVIEKSGFKLECISKNSQFRINIGVVSERIYSICL